MAQDTITLLDFADRGANLDNDASDVFTKYLNRLQ
jgi:hypothetical protein